MIETEPIQAPPSEARLMELLEIAQQRYDADLKAELEPAHNGEFIAFDVEADLYALGVSIIAAHDELRAKGSRGWMIFLRVGYPHAVEMLGLH
jgi:hypothetical protein